MEGYISEVSRSIRKKNLALFCGAGISRNSGLPLANELKQSILERIFMSEQKGHAKKSIDEIMHSNLPFEAFMEVLSRNSDISSILDLFKGGKPDTNHILIAELAKRGYLRTVLTTNFDMLIEKALEKAELNRNKDFTVYYSEEHFWQMDFDNIDDTIIRIFKIHGSAEDKYSIRTTLDMVASKALSARRMRVIKHIFSTGNHEKVLVLGYSRSDEFDITPQIQSIMESHKEIVLVNHSDMEETERTEDIRARTDKNPFKRYPGVEITCSTDKFIRNLWALLEDIIGDAYKISKSKVNWKKFADDWAETLGNNKGCHRHFIAAEIFGHISNFWKMVEHHEQSLEIAKTIGDRVREAACYTNLGFAYRNLRDFKNAIKYSETSLEKMKQMGDKEGESICYTTLGTAYDNLGDYKKAIGFYERSLRMAKATQDKSGEAICYGNLGLVCYNLADFKKAIEYYQQALQIAETMGNKLVESACYRNTGNVYLGLGDHKRAIEYYQQALQIAKAIGDRADESGCYIGLGAAYHALGDFHKGIEYSEESLQITKELGDSAGASACYTNLAKTYLGLGDSKKAIQYAKKSLQINKEVGHKSGESACYVILGAIHDTLADHKRAIEYYQQALQIAKAIGDRAGESRCYIGMGMAYSRLGDSENAIAYYSKAEDIFKKIGQLRNLKVLYGNLSLVYEEVGDSNNAEKYRKLAHSG